MWAFKRGAPDLGRQVWNYRTASAFLSPKQMWNMHQLICFLIICMYVYINITCFFICMFAAVCSGTKQGCFICFVLCLWEQKKKMMTNIREISVLAFQTTTSSESNCNIGIQVCRQSQDTFRIVFPDRMFEGNVKMYSREIQCAKQYNDTLLFASSLRCLHVRGMLFVCGNYLCSFCKNLMCFVHIFSLLALQGVTYIL